MVLQCGCSRGGPLAPVLDKDGKVSSYNMPVTSPEAAKFQDAKYGPGMRVHNPTQAGRGGKTVYRCTVCNKER